MAIDPVIIKPRFPVLSKAGGRLLVLSVPWFFATLIGLDALGLIGRDAPEQLRWLAIVPVAPYVLLVFHPWLGRLPGLRWLNHPIQPRMEISPIGLDLQLPDVGRHVYGWDEITGLRSRFGYGADLLGVDGVSLASIPDMRMVLGGGSWRRSDSIATLVVRARPDRFALSGANWAGVPSEFALRASDDPQFPSDRWARRRRWTTVAIVLAFGVVTGTIAAAYLTR